ncbi:hypothetical protein AMECASPLE_007002 [Ameca splendens]|uniref:Fibrinogen C-terminal domain-containing protein n=2 Tax=Goodeidae TaxID=28758 RepID=A0ABV0XZG7_9TELE
MRLTAFCVCGTLLAFSSLSRIRAEEGVLLGDWGFGPCTVTLRPAGACRPGEQDSTCPYHISLPPLVVHLPQHFLDLENIMQDLQKLKDTVDELREMCADCTGGQAGRKCGRQSEADLKGGKSMREDEGDWMNERLEENDRDFRQECGKEGVKVETKDGDNMEKKLNDRNKWETGGDVKENNKEEPVTEGTRGEDTLEELKMPTSGGNMQTVNVKREQIADTNPKGSARKYQDDILEKNKEETKEERGQPMWRDKTKKLDKNTKAEAFDRVKMSKNHTVNINKEQEQMEMEKGIKVDPNKKKPKQMERFGFTEKGRVIKTESVQKDGDGETSYSKTTEKTDFLSINLTTITTGLTLRLDSSDTNSFTSSLPSPSLLSSTLSSITDVIPDPKAGYGLTRSTDPGAGGVTEPHSQDKATLPTTTATISTVGGPREQITNGKAGLTTTTPHQSSFITSSPRVIDGSRVAPKNISSKIKIALKPPPYRAPQPGEKLKSGIKPEAENRLKNAKNDHKRNQGPSIERKTKLNQKQKPHKPTVVRSKPDSKKIQNKKPGQRITPDISTTKENLKNNLMHKQEVAVNDPKSKQNSSTSVQTPAPQAVNVTHSGKYTLINRESDEVSNTDQNFKLEKKSIQLVIVDKSDQKSVKRLDSEEKLNETFVLSQNLNYTPKPTVATNHPMNKSIQKIPTFNPEPEDILEFESTTKQNQKPLNESVGSFEDNITQEMKNSPDLTSGENINAHRPHTAPDNINDSSQEQLNPSQEFETGTPTTLTESVDGSGENSLQEPKSNPDLTPAQASASDKATVTHDQKKNSSQHYLETKHKPETTQESSSESNKRETSTKKTNKKQYLTYFGDKSKENPSRKSENHPDLTPEQKAICDPANTTLVYMNKSSQEDHKPKHRPETNKEYKYETAGISKENSLQEFKLNPHLTPEQTSVLDQATNNPDQKNKSSEDHLKDKHKSENIQDFKSNKSETATPKPSTEPVGMSEEKSCQKPTSNPGLRPRHRSTPDQAATSPDQMKKSSEEHRKDQKKTENIQELKSNQRETPKPNQKHLPESVDQSEDLQEPTPYPPYTPGQTTTNQATTTTDQMDKSNRDHLKTQTSQESKFNKSETATQKPSTESWVKSDEASLQEPTSNPDLPPGQTSTMDIATVTTYQVIQSSQDHLKTEHNPDKIHSFISNKSKAATPKPDQKPLTESVDKSEDNSLKQTKLYLDLTHEQTSTQDQATTAPDIMNTFNNKYLKTQTSNEFKFNKNETASQKPSNESWDKSLPGPTPNPGLTSRHRSTLDLATATPNKMKKSTNSNIQTEPYHETKINKSETARPKPSTESWEKPEEESLQEPSSNLGLGPRETSTSDLDTATTDQINKSINDHPEAKHIPETIKGFRSNTSETATPKPNQKPSPKSKSKEQERKNNSDSTSSNQVKTPLDQRSKPSHNVPKFNKTPKPGQEPKQNQKNPKVAPSLKTRPNANIKSNQTQQTNPRRNTPRPGLRPYLKPILVPEKILKSAYNKTSKLRPPFRHRPSARPTVKPGVKPIQRLKEAVEPEPSPQTKTGPSQISWGPSGNIQTSRTDMPPTSSLVKQIAIVSHTPRETEFSTSVRKTITLSPNTSNSLETGYFPALQAHPEDVTSSPNTRITSDLRPQTAGPPSSVPRTTRPNKINNGILQNVFTSTGPGSTQPSVAPKPKAKTLYVEKSPSASPVSSPSLKTTSTLSTNFRPKTSSTSGPELPPAELSTPSPRELRVKINQVAAFVNNSLIPNGRSGELPKEQPDRSQRGREHERTDGKLPTSAASTAIRDCSDHSLRGRTRSGVYLVTPDLRGSSFPVFCDMELDGGGWTLLQRRQDGSVSFNRTWVEYQAGFGVLDGGEFWLGNNKMHLLTRDRDMVLRVELEDFDGLTEHAQYEHFRVASERLRYRLTVGGYSGTAGDALRFSRTYDHNNRMFTTPDRDHDRYPSGNCGAYYSSGWWFDACMAANLNGRYYVGKYKGVRDGIYWGTWHNISTEYYPTNERLSFKSVRMMIRPKSFGPR